MLNQKKAISIPFNAAELKERNQALSFLLEMSDFLADALGTEALLSGALEKIMSCFQIDAGRMYVLDESGETLTLAASRGIAVEGLETVDLREGFSGKSASSKSFIAQHVSDLDDPSRVERLSNQGFRIIICVPLIVMDQVVGVMNLAVKKVIELSQERIDLLTALGNQIAVSINNAKLYQQLREKMMILREKRDMIKFFAYSVSHDLKGPAISAHGLARLLSDKYASALDDKGRAYCRRIMQATEQMALLTEDLNAFIASRESSMRFAPVDLSRILESVQEEYADALERRHIRWSRPPVLPVIVAHELSMLRVFRNLLENALKYGGEQLRRIHLDCRDSPGEYRFSFQDDGAGIAAEDRDKILELFHRRQGAGEVPGTGLGLPIVNEIVRRHGGAFWLDTTVETGTCFRFTISKALESGNGVEPSPFSKDRPLSAQPESLSVSKERSNRHEDLQQDSVAR